MKIIGLMLTWNNLEFFRCAVKQALEFCDELILVEGCHSLQYPQHSDDGTVTFIQTIKAHPKLKIMDFARHSSRYDYTQRIIRQEYPKRSHYYEPGNWIFHWDDDLLFMNEDLRKLRNMMQDCKEDSIDFLCRWFSYNFRLNAFGRMSPICYRITEGLMLQGVSNAHYRNRRPYSISYPNGMTAFHYSYVKRMERVKARCALSAEKGTPKAMERFEAWKRVVWDKEEDVLKNGNLSKIMSRGKLNIYRGPHPEALDSHPWRYIDDVRKMK